MELKAVVCKMKLVPLQTSSSTEDKKKKLAHNVMYSHVNRKPHMRVFFKINVNFV